MSGQSEPRGSKRLRRRCLIVERHNWETGGAQQQLQFPLEAADTFFGSGVEDRSVRVRVFLDPGSARPTFEKQITVSRVYRNRTRRTNRFREMGSFPHAFLFFQETDQPHTYDVWWQQDMAIVAAKYDKWNQASSTQYGRGRLWIIVPAPVPRLVDRL